MRIKLGKSTAAIHRDEGPKIYRESTFWRHVQRALGKNWIVKLMHKDGHLVSTLQHYTRTRDARLMLYQLDYAIREVYEDYNRKGCVTVGRVA